jgi:hypothetical protein
MDEICKTCGHLLFEHYNYVDVSTNPLGPTRTECSQCDCKKFIAEKLYKQADVDAMVADHEKQLRALVEVMTELKGFVEFYTYREVHSPSNHQEFAREAEERLHRFMAALAPFESQGK